MLLRESLQKTKNFFHKTLQNLKSFLFGGYQKLPKAPPFLSCGWKKPKNHQTDHQFCIDFSNGWGYDQSQAKMGMKKIVMSLEESMKEEDALSGGLVKNNQETGGKGKKDIGEGELSSEKMEGGGYALAEKMKELEMMNMGDVEHVLDVEEAMHYYSRLKSPVYLDIVDKFFKDMHSEFSAPQASASINNSKRRLGSIRL